jgi:NAD(P)-dependent dehydrogenase (short-subunit alcohol dehydrogenase family)
VCYKARLAVNAARDDVALVTGASSGIGLATVAALARRSYKVVATMRDLGRAEPLRQALEEMGLSAEVELLDVTSDESVSRCADRVLERHGRIDVVVNNAGVGRVATLEELSIADLVALLDVNCVGVARVTKAFLPAMRQAGRGHLIAVSSIGGVFGQPFNEAYCAAKFALEGLYESLAPVAAELGISVSLVEAGMVATEFYRRSVAEADYGFGPYAEMGGRFLRTADAALSAGQRPDELAELIATVADDPNPKLRYQSAPEVIQLLGRKLTDLDGSAVLRITRRWIS